MAPTCIRGKRGRNEGDTQKVGQRYYCYDALIGNLRELLFMEVIIEKVSCVSNGYSHAKPLEGRFKGIGFRVQNIGHLNIYLTFIGHRNST